MSGLLRYWRLIVDHLYGFQGLRIAEVIDLSVALVVERVESVRTAVHDLSVNIQYLFTYFTKREINKGKLTVPTSLTSSEEG